LRRPLRIFLWIVGSLGVGFIALVGWAVWRVINPDYVFSNGRALEENLSGRWDWSTDRVPCEKDSARMIAFSSDGGVMTITQERPVVDSTGRDWTVTTYDILARTPSRVRGEIRGEPRRTDKGDPVVWDLVVIDSNAYMWHRTDWPAWGYTARVIRCPATGPDEPHMQ
jgi:hypothetical protein